MARRVGRATGQFTLRCDLATHRSLIEACELLSEDVQTVGLRLIKRGLPDLLRKAREAACDLLAARLSAEELGCPVDDEVFRRLAVVAHRVPAGTSRQVAVEEALVGLLGSACHDPGPAARAVLMAVDGMTARAFYARRLSEADTPEAAGAAAFVAAADALVAAGVAAWQNLFPPK